MHIKYCIMCRWFPTTTYTVLYLDWEVFSARRKEKRERKYSTYFVVLETFGSVRRSAAPPISVNVESKELLFYFFWAQTKHGWEQQNFNWFRCWLPCKDKMPKIWNKYSIPRKGISGSQSQVPHSCVCERIIYSHDGSVFSAGGNMWTYPATI